jgi:DNA invertase Pin-like site-specific DNA recombinase
MGEVKICALYGRESVLDESVEHGSLEQQKYMGLAVAESLTEASGIEHRVEFVLIEELGVSGKDQNRPKFQELLQLIRADHIDVVIAKEISRLTRSVSDFCEFMELCREHGVAVKIKGLDVDPNTPMGGAMFQILAVVAQLEREMCRERVKSTLRSAMINNKKINGGPIILGFDRDPERKGFWIKNDKEIKQVIFLMQTFCENLSYKETVNAANDKGILNKNKRPFTKSSINNLLKNKRYIGRQRVPRDDGKEAWIDLPFGAVVPVDLFDRVQSCVELVTKKYGRNNKNQRRPYPLSGLLYHEDGSKFEVSPVLENLEMFTVITETEKIAAPLTLINLSKLS